MNRSTIWRISTFTLPALIAVFAGCETQVGGLPGGTNQSATIEPDDHAEGTELTNISEHVTLWTTADDNVPIELFTVTANDDGFDYAPTGNMVFGHANIGFWNNDRRLRMDFNALASAVSITFAGGTFGATEIGRLQVYDIDDNLLAEYVADPLGPGEAEVMTINRASSDIAWAIAYIADGEGSFGRLDDLNFTVDTALVNTGLSQ